MQNNFLYADIGESITDAYILRDNTVEGIVSFPFGQKDILKSALLASNFSQEIFLSKIAMKHAGHDDAISDKDLLPFLEKGMKLWVEKLSVALSTIFTEINMPKTKLIREVCFFF